MTLQGPDALRGLDTLSVTVRLQRSVNPRRPVRPRRPVAAQAYDKDYEAYLLAAVDHLLSGCKNGPVAVCARQWTVTTVFATWALYARPTTGSTRTLTNFNALIRDFRVRIRMHGPVRLSMCTPHVQPVWKIRLAGELCRREHP